VSRRLRDRLGPRWRNACFEESALQEYVAGTQFDRCTRFKRRDVRNDDGARPPQGSPRSARHLVVGRGESRACPSASPGVCDSDDSSPRIFAGGEASPYLRVLKPSSNFSHTVCVANS